MSDPSRKPRERRPRPLPVGVSQDEYFAMHPEVLADWAHQNGYLPMGYGEEGYGKPVA